MGVRHAGGHQGVAGGLWGEYVIACMRREGKTEGHKGGGRMCSGATTRRKQTYRRDRCLR